MRVQPVGARGRGGGVRSDERRAFSRLLPTLLPVVAAGAAVLAAAVLSVVTAPPSLAGAAGVLALFAAALLAEAYPVPVESLPGGYVSLAAVFFVGAAVLFGPAEAAVIAVGVRVTLDLAQHRPRVRLLYNGGAYALSAGAAGAAAAAVGSGSVGHLVLQVVAAACAYYVVNVVLISAAIARWAGEPFFSILRTSAYWTIVPFAIMTSGSLMLAVLWERSPPLALALFGPLLAVALYQRSMHQALVATRLALTDALTGLGNQGHFHERLQQELDEAEAERRPLALCLLDVDELKLVNDRYGHAVGDRLLAMVGSCLRHGGEAFRVGGDEFALLLPRREAEDALPIAEAVLRRVTALEVVPGHRTRISAGLAVFPTRTPQRSGLYRAADEALYASKREGLNRVHVYRGDNDPHPLGAVA